MSLNSDSVSAATEAMHAKLDVASAAASTTTAAAGKECKEEDSKGTETIPASSQAASEEQLPSEPPLEAILNEFLPSSEAKSHLLVDTLCQFIHWKLYETSVQGMNGNKYTESLKVLHMDDDSGAIYQAKKDVKLFLPFVGRVTLCRTAWSLPVAIAWGLAFYVDGTEQSLLSNVHGHPAWKLRIVEDGQHTVGVQKQAPVSEVSNCART